jgi:hypothetical protein
MKYHKINPQTGEYISSRQPQTDDKGRKLGSAKNEVIATLPLPATGKVRVWKNKKFILLDDNRGSFAYRADGTKTAINTIGKLPNNQTLNPPPSKFHKLKKDYQDFAGADQWEPNTAKKTELIKFATAVIELRFVEVTAKFTHEPTGYTFVLSKENMFTYKAEFDIRDLLTYPYKVKHESGYIELQNADEYKDFYLAGFAYIRQKTEESWAEQDALQNMTTKQLIEFINNPG